MPSSSKQLIKTVHQNSSSKQLAETASQNNLLNQLTNIGLHRFPYPLFSCSIFSTLFHGGFYMASQTYRQALGVKILNSSHPRIRKLKREGHDAAIHGNKFWNSSFLIMQHLKKHPPKNGVKVLEIGCGWGLLGIFCAKQFGARVTGIDADAAVGPYLHLHAEINEATMQFQKKTFAQLSAKDLAEFDLILGADICFWDELAMDIYRLIKRAKKKGRATCIVADPCRPPFNAMAERMLEENESAQLLRRRLSRPVRASGDLLIVP